MNREVEGERFILEAGTEMYSEHCAVCHGERMEGAASSRDKGALLQCANPCRTRCVNVATAPRLACGAQE